MKHYATRGLSLVCAAALVLSGCNASSSQTVEPTVIGESGTLACVGDSITFGAGVRKTRDTDSYPAMLQTLLGDAWTVENFGNPGSTLMAGTNRPYTEQEEYQASLNMAADVYLVMLGTNDAKPDFWDTDTFVEEYETFLSTYEDVNPDAQIFLMTPPCVYAQDSDNPEYYGAMGDNVDAEVVAAVHTVAEKVGVPVIDLHTFTADHPEWFADGLHPNKVGNSAIAQYIYYQITGTEGEITLPAVVSLPEGTVIGCVGDSTTYGSGVMKTRDTESYPALLQEMLDDGITVENYGMGSQTVMPGTDAPYREHSIYRTSQKEPCDFYIIMMGTNDAKNAYWDPEQFRTEFLDFVQDYQNLVSAPQIYLMTPVTVYVVEGQETVNYDINADNLDQAAQIVSEIAEELDLPLIDIHALTADHPEWFADGVHPNAEGNAAIAQAVYDALTSE